MVAKTQYITAPIQLQNITLVCEIRIRRFQHVDIIIIIIIKTHERDIKWYKVIIRK